MTLGRTSQAPSYAQVVSTPTQKQTGSSASVSKSNVKVVVRIRPENQLERDGNSRIVVNAMNENVLVFDPKEQSSPEYGYRNRHRRRDIRKRQCKDLSFAFDCVFDNKSTNQNVYESSTRQILDGLLEGYNCSVFAYGATGAGKTHTMLGNPSQPGVIYLTMMDLYSRIAAVQHEKTCDVAVSYLEVYNEQIHDLLVKGSCLPVREDARSGVVIPGLSLHKPRNAEELLHMLHFGNQNRTQHPTDANAESSRSHAVFQVYVRQRDRTANISTEVRIAKMCLVDLAGSERATVTKNCGARFREGANINRSLLALGNVINALADAKYKGHVPYRDSKLTRLLKDSLGGNCQTVMIAAVSPSSMSYEDTYNTLKYADRAKHIQAQLKKNVLNVDFHVARYGQIVEELRKEITELKGKLQGYEDNKMATVHQQCTLPDAESIRLKHKMEDVYTSRLQICREYLDSELKSRDLKWKISRKERCLARMAAISDIQQKETKEKIQKLIQASRQRIHSFHQAKEEKGVRLAESNHSLEELKGSVRVQTNDREDSMATENLNLSLQYHESSLALTESQYCIKYLAKVVKFQEREITTTERLILRLLHLVKQQHIILKGHNLMSPDLENEYHTVKTITEGREVTFADQSLSDNTNFSLSEMLNFKSFPAAQDMREGEEPVSNQSSMTSLSSVDQDFEGPHRVHNRQNMQPARVQNDKSSLGPARHLSSRTEIFRPVLRPVTRPGHSQGPTDNSKVLSVKQSLLVDSVFSQTAGHTPAHCKSSVSNGEKDSSVMCSSDSSEVIGSSHGLAPDVTRTIEQSCAQSCGESVSAVTNECRQACGRDNVEPSHDLNSTYTLSDSTSDSCIVKPIPVMDKYVHHTNTLSHTGSNQVIVSSTSSSQYSKCVDGSCVSGTITSAKVDPSSIVAQVSDVKPSLLSLLNIEPLASNAIGLSSDKGTISKSPLTNLKSSTITKTNPVSSGTITKETNSHQLSKDKSSCVRSIHFDEMCTPVKVRSYAEVASTPPTSCGRVPLRQVNNNTNTPLATLLTPVTNSNPEEKENTPILKKTPSLTFQLAKSAVDDTRKDCVKQLHQFGLLSMVDRSQDDTGDLPKGNTPGYMRMTKAASGRLLYKHQRGATETSDPQREQINRPKPGRSLSRQKSKSTSSLARRGWQL